MLNLRALFSQRTPIVLAALIVLWHFVAVFVLASSPTVNANYAPDRIRDTTYAEFAEELGLTGAPVPLTLDLYEPSGSTVAIRINSVVEQSGERYLGLKSRMRGHDDYVVLTYSEIQWATGPNPSIEMTFGDEVTRILLVGEGYSYWRCMTFRGAEAYTFDPSISYDGSFTYTTVGEVIQSAKTVKITIPNDLVWQRTLGRIG